MTVIEPGVSYDLHEGQYLEFGPAANGTTNEEVIEVLIHRLRWLNQKLPCRENSLALTKLEEALHWLGARGRNRAAQGVTGTSAPHAS